MLPWWVEADAERHLLALREILVRCDENLKANTLMQDCVPYFLEEDHHPRVLQEREMQAEMVAHITGGPEAYAAYYQANAHERPFEDQYQIQADEAHKHIPRVELLRSSLQDDASKRIHQPKATPPVLLDCACNDGWMGVSLLGLVDYHGLDLNPGCIERAKGRHIRRARFAAGNIHDAAELTAEFAPEGRYDYVVCFECLEHVPDPDHTMRTLLELVKPGGVVYVSTPAGAVEQGNLPAWWHVEPKGHVRVYTPRTFTTLLEAHGELEGMALGPDQVLVARLRAPG